jgi:Ni/Fe-hydrogenase 1 B-type cytochrome subunit
MNAEESRERVLVDVWDGPTRLLHWIIASLVITLGVLMLTKDAMGAWEVSREIRRSMNTIHAYTGYTLVVFFALRILWSFVGNRYARWSDFVPVSKEQRRGIAEKLKWYLSGFKTKVRQAVGHDPFASVFYSALFLVLLMMTVTGILLTGVELNMFPGTVFTGGLSEEAAEGLQHFLGEIHEFGFFFLIFFLVVHLIGLVVHELKEKTGLISSMVHGKKYLRKSDLAG